MLGRISRYGRARARRPGPAVPGAGPAAGVVPTVAGAVTECSWGSLGGGGHLLADEGARLLGRLVDAGLAGQDPGHHVLERVLARLHRSPARVVRGDLAVSRRLHHGAAQRVVAEHGPA